MVVEKIFDDEGRVIIARYKNINVFHATFHREQVVVQDNYIARIF